jgi:hypothetical protein
VQVQLTLHVRPLHAAIPPEQVLTNLLYAQMLLYQEMLFTMLVVFFTSPYMQHSPILELTSIQDGMVILVQPQLIREQELIHCSTQIRTPPLLWT